jgi:hypothetical protein
LTILTAGTLKVVSKEREPITAEFDKFKDLTMVSTQPTHVWVGPIIKHPSWTFREYGPDVTFRFFCKGQHDTCQPEDGLVWLSFDSQEREWTYIKLHSLVFLADGQRIVPATEEKWDGNVIDGGVLESVTATLRVPDYLKLVAAKDVEGQLGSLDFRLSMPDYPKIDAHLTGWRALAERIQGEEAGQPSSQTAAIPESLKQAIISNSKAGTVSPAAAASLAETGRVLSPEALADSIAKGQASKCAVITDPPGAEVDIDGNEGGVSPLVFVLLKRGENPRTITIKLKGYKTVEKKVIPEGRPIPIGLKLEAESK